MAIAFGNEVDANSNVSQSSLATPAANHLTGNAIIVPTNFTGAGISVSGVTDTAGNLYVPCNVNDVDPDHQAIWVKIGRAHV